MDQTSPDLLYEALNLWGRYAENYNHYEDLLRWSEGTGFAASRNAVLMAIRVWTQDERIQLLKEHWGKEYGGFANVPVEATVRFNPSHETLARLNHLIEFNRMPREVLHLYVHAHLFRQLGMPGPLDELGTMLRRAMNVS